MSEFEEEVKGAQLPSPAPGAPQDAFIFESIADLEIPPELNEFDEGVDPEYNAMLDRHAKQINMWSPAPTGNINSPYPGPVNPTYHPNQRRRSPNLSSSSGSNAYYLAALNKGGAPNPYLGRKEKPLIADPVYGSIKADNFDRYYESSKFNELGFHPFRDNEEVYNQNSTIWNDMGRMSGELGSLAGTSISSAYRSMFNPTDTMDVEAAIEFEDAMRVGESTRGGAMAWTNNFLLQSGYTVGVIGQIAMEELAMWGGTAALAASGVGTAAAPAAAAASTARTTTLLAKLGRVIKNTFGLGRFASGTRAMLKGMNNADKARDYYSGLKAGGNFLGNLLAPETVRAFKTLNTTQNGAQTLNFIGKSAKAFGGMYRDIRSINFALAEGKMEAGSVFREHVMNDYAIQADKNMKAGLGNIVTEKQMADIAERGRKAAFLTTVGNAPVIYLSNQLLLGNAFGGFKRALPQMIKEGIEGGAKRVIRTGATLTGKGGARKVGKQVFEDIGESFLGIKQFYKTVRSAGLKGGLQYTAGAGLRYFAANFAEGAQEVYQEALAHGVKDYYKALAFDPTAGGLELLKSSVRSGAGSQMSGQGFDVFMSGFLMGGVVSLPQKMVFQGMPMLYQRTFNNEKFQEYKAAKEKYYTDLVNTYNEAWDKQANLDDFFSADNMNFLIQKQVSEEMKDAEDRDSMFDWQDSKDFARFQKMHDIFSHGKSSEYKEQLNDYLNLSDEELAQAFPQEKSRAKSGKLRASIQKQLANLEKTEAHYEKNKDKMQNPYDPRKYNPGTREFIDEKLKHKAYEHARYLYMFSQDGVRRAAERSASITEELASDSIFTYSSIQDVSASDITVLLTEDSLLKEIENLEKEIPGLGEAGTKRLKKQKETKLKKLKAIADVLYAKENQTKGGGFDRRKINKVAPLFIEYFQSLSKQKGKFLNQEAVYETIKKIIDKNHLDARVGAYSKTVEILNNPQYLDEVIRRSYEYFKYAYDNKIEIFKEQIKKYVNKKEINQMLNQFLQIGVYPNEEQLKEFIETNDVDKLKDFYSKEGPITKGGDVLMWAMIESVKYTYKATAEGQEQQKKEKAEKAKESKKSETTSSKKVDDILDNAEIEGSDVIVYGKVKGEHPTIDQILEAEYQSFLVRMAQEGVIKSKEYFLKLERPQNIIAAYAGLKNLWEQTIQVKDKAEKDRIFKSDEGFLDWLSLQEGNNLVQDILSATNLGIIDFIPNYQKTFGNLETEIVEEIVEKYSDDYILIYEVESWNEQLGRRTKHYQIRDNRGRAISDDVVADLGLTPGLVFPTLKEAEKELRALKRSMPDGTKFSFGGMDVHFGMIVKDKKTGTEYFIKGEPDVVSRTGNVHLIPVKNLKKGQNLKTATKGKLVLTENQFRNKFIVETINLSTAALPDNVTKLRLDEPVSLQPHENRGEESIDESRARFQAIISMLSPEELASLGLRVTKNENGGKIIRKEMSLGDKDPNPLISQTRQLYTIAITIPEELQGKINSKLKSLGIDPSNRDVLGYVPNNDVILYDRQGNIIDPKLMTIEQAKDLFAGKITEENLEYIKNNFGIQYTIMNIIKEKMGDGNTIELNLEELGEEGASFFNTAGSMSFLKEGTNPVSELSQSTVEGETVIVVTDRDKKGRISSSMKTTLTGTGKEKRAFIEKIEQEMSEQNVRFKENIKQSGARYVMIVKQDNGVYSYIPLKPDEMSVEEVEGLTSELIDRSIQTVKENTTSTKEEDTLTLTEDKKDVKVSSTRSVTKVKKQNYNAEWNAEFNQRFYIASSPGYSIEINVVSNGGIQLKVYDKNNKAIAAESYLNDQLQVESYKDSNNKSELLQTLFKQFQSDVRQKISTEKNATKKKALEKVSKLSFELSNIRKSFPKTAPLSDIAENSSTTIAPEIRKQSKLNVVISGINYMDVNSVLPITIDKGPSVKDIGDVEDEINIDEVSVGDISIEDFNKYKEDGFVDLPVIFIESIANKLINNDNDVSKLSKIEQEIYNSDIKGVIDLTITAIAAEKNKGTTNTTNTVKGKKKTKKAPVIDTATSEGVLTIEGVGEGGYQKFVGEELIGDPAAPIVSTTEGLNENIIGDKKVFTLKQKTRDRQFRPSSYTISLSFPADSNVTLDDVRSKLEGMNNKIKEFSSSQDILGSLNVNGVPQTVQQIVDRNENVFDTKIEKAPVKSKTTTKKNKSELTNEVLVSQLRSEINALKTEVRNREDQLLKELGPAEAFKALKTDALIKKIKAKITKAQSDLVKLSANKIISETLESDGVDDINSFIEWASDALPDFISVEDIRTLGNNMKSGGMRVGAFVMALNNIAGKMSIDGKIYTGTSTKHAYHEAFHAVFRMLLTKEQQEKYYELARKEVLAKLRAEGKTLQSEIERLKNSDIEQYGELSKKELENLYYEEYMADQFEIFKQSPKKTKTASFIKSLFNRIVEWIKSALGTFNANELQGLYENISAGKFRTSDVASNPFTEAANMGITINASKVIRSGEATLEDGTVAYTNLDERTGRGIVNSITARVIVEVQKNEDPNLDLAKLVTESINKYRKLYNIENPQYQNIGETPGLFQKLMSINNAFDNYTDDFVDAVLEILSIYDLKVKRINDSNEDLENQYGLRTTSDWDKDASMTGGFRSLSNFIRRYIGTTTFVDTVSGEPITDEFGNQYLDPASQEPLLTTVNFAEAYTGFLKAVSGKTDPIAILQSLYYFGQNNPQTKAVVNRLFNDLGIVWEGQLEKSQIPGQTKNNYLFQAFIKGFENFKVDYLFIHTRKSDNEVFIYDAANRDDANSQIDKWGQAYQELFQKFKENPVALKEILNSLDDLLSYLDESSEELKFETEEEQNAFYQGEARDISKSFKDVLGISLHPDFIHFSIAKNLQERTKLQASLVDRNKDALSIDVADIQEILTLTRRENNGKPDPGYLFSDNEDGSYGRLRRLALGNAKFDESVGVSVFRNAAGDLVYAHQLPTFHLKEIMALNDVEGEGKRLDAMRESDEYLANNALLNEDTELGQAFKQMSAEGRLKITRVSGSKSSLSIQKGISDDVTEEFDANEEGTTYGDLNPKQFVQMLLSAYTGGYNQANGTVKDVALSKKKDAKTLALAPILLRVLEASSTGDMVYLPVIKAVMEDANGNAVITDEALETFVGRVETELERIVTELDQTQATYNENTGEGKLIPGYNATKDGQNYDPNGRAFKFTNTGNLLSSASVTADTSEKTVEFLHSADVVDNVRSDGQRIFFLSAKAAARNKFTIAGEIKNVLLKKGESVKKGKRTFFQAVENDQGTLHRIKLIGENKKITGETQASYIQKFGDALSAEKTQMHLDLTEKQAEKYRVVIDNQTSLWANTRKIADFLNGKSKGEYVYEIVEDGTTAEATETLDFKERLEQSIKELVEAKEYVSLDTALKNMNSSREELKKFMSDRIDAEAIAFSKELEEVVGNDLPKFISEGIVKAPESKATDANIAATNRKLNLTDNKAHNIKQIFINDWINTTAINDILLGDQSMTLKDAVDAVKRAKMQNAAFYSAKSVIGDPKSGIKPVTEIAAFPLTEPQGKSIHTKKDIDVADAQMYMTANAFKHIWFGVGKGEEGWSKFVDKILAGEKIAPEEIYGKEGAAKKQWMLNSKKFVYGDGQTFIKMSGWILTKEYTSYKNEKGEWVARPDREELHNMRVKMEKYEEENDTISIAAPLSAFKMLKENVTPIEDFVNSSDKPLSKNQTMTLNAEYFGLQVLNPSNKMEIVDPTQIKTLITGEQSDDVEVIIGGDKVKIGDIRERYHKGVSDRVTQKYQDKRNLIFTFDVDYAMNELHTSIEENKITVDLLNYLEYAQTSLESSQSAAEIIEYFTYDQDTGEQKYQLNNPIVKAKFEQLFLTYFKSSLSERVKGTSAALVSDKGVKVYRRVLSVDENGYPDRQEIIRSDEFLSQYSITDLVQEGDKPLDFSDDDQFGRLKLEVEDSKGKGVIILDRLRHNMKEYNINGDYTGVKYSESLFPAHDINVMREIADKPQAKIPDVISKMFGVRIPSQAHHSAMNIKVVDFLPVYYGSSIISSRELVEVSGADFDIDKLYMQMKEYYNEGGNFYQYKDNFQDYARYVNANVNKSGTIYAEAKFKSTFGLNQSYTDAELKKYKDGGLSRSSIDALGELGLPRTEAEYNKFKEVHDRPPYAAALDNQILDDKFVLLGNEGLTEKIDGKDAIAYEPADIEVLDNLWKEIQEEFPELAELANEDGLDANNIWGKWRSFNNNQEGAGSIGAVVLPNLFLSLMQENEVKFKSLEGVTSEAVLEFNDIKYNKYTNKKDKKTGVDYAREILEDGTSGRRKQYVLSALITAMTDNAKERLAKKLHLSINALGVVANMTALGVPIRTSVLLVSSPIIRNIYTDVKLSEEPVRVGDLLDEKIVQLDKALGELSEGKPYQLLTVNQELISESINDPLVPFGDASDLYRKIFNTDKDGKVILGSFKEGFESTPEQIEREINILQQFKVAHEISEYTNAMKKLIDLSSGFGRDIQAMNEVQEAIVKLGLNLTDSQYNALPNSKKPLIDVRSMFKGNTWHSTNLKVFNEFYNNLLPKVFITQSKTFKSIYSSIINNGKGFLKKEERQAVENDLLSYLTLKAYIHNGLQTNSQSIASIDNGLLYPQDAGKSIVDVVKETKKQWNENTDGAFNYFLQEFIILEEASQKGNKTGIDMIASNTFSKLNQSQRISLQNGFKELFNNPETRDSAMKIVHYLMVKDGLQPKYKSLIAALNPFALSRYLGVIDNVQDTFAKNEPELMKKTFGLTYDELIKEYLDNYFVAASAAKYANRVSLSSDNVYDPRATVEVMSSNSITRRHVENNPDTLYIVFDNESGIGQNYGRSIRGMENTISIDVSKGNTPEAEDNFYSAEEADGAIKELNDAINLIKEARLQYKKVVFPKQLLGKADRAAIKKGNKTFYNTLQSELKLNFEYNIAGDTKKQKAKAARTVNEKALNKSIYLDMSNDGSAILNIDIERGMGKKVKFNENEFFTLTKPVTGQTTKSRADNGRIKKNRVSNLRFTNRFNSSRETINSQDENLILFPAVTTIKVGNRIKYFRLSKVAGPLKQKGTVSQSNPVAMGTAAIYVEVPKVGTTAQFGGGFIGGSIPASSIIREYIAEVNSEKKDSDDSTDNGAGENYDMTFLRKMASGGNIVYDQETGKITSNGSIITNVEIKDEGDGTGEITIETDDNILGDEDSVEGDSIELGADDRILNPIEEAVIQNFWNNLTENQVSKLKTSGVKNVQDLLQMSKLPQFKNVNAFLEEIKQCFL